MYYNYLGNNGITNYGNNEPLYNQIKCDCSKKLNKKIFGLIKILLLIYSKNYNFNILKIKIIILFYNEINSLLIYN